MRELPLAKNMVRFFAATALLLPAAFAQAQHGHPGGGHGHGAPPVHGGYGGFGSYRHVPPAPYLGDHWREGHWHHGDHGHYGGWWWVVGPSWFWYASPVYPYPDAYVPPEVVIAMPPGPPPTQYWYWCEQPAGYYPYVTQCNAPWKAVTVTPAPSPAPPGQ